ncbi:MAG: alginate lyase family protein [Paracoccaceae bacterium]
MLPARRQQSLQADGSFNFLNKTRQLKDVGWDGDDCAKLWRYNQHYFDDLNAIGAAKRHGLHRNLMLDWVSKNQPGQGSGWEPYPTSLRIVNWMKWSLSGHELPNDCLQSLAVQTRWLAKNIEWHILGNHLFANAKALVFAGLFFEGVEAQNWLDTGLQIISDEIAEQVLPDGAHFELSPMYHSIFLEDVLDLINIFTTFDGGVSRTNVESLQKTAAQMLNWLNGMCHPDAEITFFNDSAHNIAPSPGEIRTYAKRLGINHSQSVLSGKRLSITHFADSGYIQLRAPQLWLFLDVASIGPDYLPGHGHADTLSFEMSLFGQRVFVNGGTSRYGTGEVRLTERGSAAHNTVVVNDENSSEVWSGFRVARRATIHDLIIDKTVESVSVSCSHDGYKRLTGRPIHNRRWVLSDGKLLVQDLVDGAFDSAKAYFHLYPDITIAQAGKQKWELYLPEKQRVVRLEALAGFAKIEPSFFSPEFGVRIPTMCLTIGFQDIHKTALEISW